MTGDRTTSERMTVEQLFAALEQLTDAERASAIGSTNVRPSRIVHRLGIGSQRRLVKICVRWPDRS